jgi:hypothetical protein
VLINAVDLNNRFGSPLEELTDLLADGRGGLLLGEKPVGA